MTKIVTAYCSWCYTRSKHKLCDTHWYSRNEYICKNCGSYVVKCSVCDEMAKSRLNEKQISELEKLAGKKGRKWISKLSDNWKDMYCAQHNGTIADFKTLSKRVKTLDKYPDLLEPKHTNMKKTTTITAGVLTTAGVVALTLVTGGAAATAVAAGKLGLLGAASTGTAISTLSGAALTSASLAAIGGSVAAGTTIIAAIGVGLGGYAGGVIANKYAGEDKYFGIHIKRKKSTNNTIFINGLLQQKNVTFNDWMLCVNKK